MKQLFVFIIACLFLLFGCSKKNDKPNTVKDTELRKLPLEEIVTYVQKSHPATNYATNEFLPPQGSTPVFTPLATPLKIKIGMPWVLNDEEAAWYIASEKGFFADVGLDVELVPGGPGRDHLATVLAGTVDIGVTASSAAFIRIINSRTSGELIAVAAFLKENPYSWIMLDPNTPQDQRSTLKITPEILKGKKVGIQAGYEFIWPVLAQKWDMDINDIQLSKVGFTPAVLMQGTVDFYAAWLVNQPRILEENGFYNWVALEFRNEGITSQGDVSVVRKETLQKQPDMIRRYLAALTRATHYLLEKPHEAALITQRWAKDADLSVEQIKRRFELQRPLVEGDSDSPPLFLNLDALEHQTALLYKYSQIEKLKK